MQYFLSVCTESSRQAHSSTFKLFKKFDVKRLNSVRRSFMQSSETHEKDQIPGSLDKFCAPVPVGLGEILMRRSSGLSSEWIWGCDTFPECLMIKVMLTLTTPGFPGINVYSSVSLFLPDSSCFHKVTFYFCVFCSIKAVQEYFHDCLCLKCFYNWLHMLLLLSRC